MSEHLDEAAKVDERLYFLDAPEHPGVAALADYWRKKCAQRALPDRTDIVPSEIVRLLPNLHIAEVLDGGRDFRLRLFGTALVGFLGVEMTGKRLSELGMQASIITDADAARRRWTDVAERSYAGASPVFATGYLVNTLRRGVRWHAFSAPMTAGGSDIAQLLGALFFVEQR